MVRSLGAGSEEASRRALMSGTESWSLRRGTIWSRVEEAGGRGGRPRGWGERKKKRAGSGRERKSRTME